ncbi:MAG: sigma-70 family RNA polymerase sigma factor, partial [Thioalkalispiraceae bacterium]
MTNKAKTYTSIEKSEMDRLLEQHAELVHRIAYHLSARLPATVLVDDLIQAGLIGLMDAASHYDPSQGAAFETYASIRIRGSMLDELRRNDWAPKSVHRKSRDMLAAVNKIEARTGRDARPKEIARTMGISIDEYHQLVLETNTCR